MIPDPKRKVALLQLHYYYRGRNSHMLGALSSTPGPSHFPVQPDAHYHHATWLLTRLALNRAGTGGTMLPRAARC